MDPFNIFIEESVLYASNQYYDKMLKTKVIFFKSLNQNKKLSDFKTEIHKIWGNVDHSYMEQQIKQLEDMVSAKNFDGHEVLNANAKFEEIFKLEPESRFISVERKYEDTMIKYYDNRLKTINKGNVDKETYLSNLIDKYDNTQATIPYYNKNGTVRSYHNIASYNSMLYNVNMNRSGWNRTMYDSKLLDNDLTYLPAHPFACPLCAPWQGKVYSVSGKTKGYPPKELAIDGGIGHPNCKHQWTIYWSDEQLQKDTYNSTEWEEKYKNKQKIQSLELQRRKYKTDVKIYEEVGNWEKVDKTKSKISTLNKNIKKLK